MTLASFAQDINGKWAGKVMEQDSKVTGKLEGETLKLKMNVMGNEVDLVLKKEIPKQ